MPNKIFNLTTSFKAQVNDEGDLRIKGFASTSDVDRSGDVIELSAWTKGGLKNFTTNPVILFNHDHNRPVGRAVKIEPSKNGLEIEAIISKAAGDVYNLVKDGVLGAFSVGFGIKDADIINETGGLLIKDAELFEVSVVSVPCNQAAIFSVAKSFNSDEEYKDFVENFTNSANLAGQSLAKGEENSSNVASDAPEGGKPAKMEKRMDVDNKVDYTALAREVAKETAAAIAMERAKEKAAEEAAAKKAAEEAAAKKAQEETVVKTVQSGTEKLVEDFQAKMNERDANLEEVLKSFKGEFETKLEEITKANSMCSHKTSAIDLESFPFIKACFIQNR